MAQASFKKFFSFISSRDKEKEGEREEEKHRYERETSIGGLLYTPQLGTEPATQACAQLGNQTLDLSVCRMTLNPLSGTGHGSEVFIGRISQIH